MIDTLRQDVVHAARTLLKSPSFAIVAVLSLAIGIGGTAAVFSVADALLLRPLPGIADPDRLVDVGGTHNGRPLDTMSYPNFADLRDRNTVFQGVAAYRPVSAAFGFAVDGASQQIYGRVVSGNYFDVVGVGMALGRALTPDDDRINSPRASLVLSHSFWQSRFNGHPSVLGRVVRLNGVPFTIVGVAAPGFTGTSVAFADVWLPITMQPVLDAVGNTAPLAQLGPAGALTSRLGVWMVAIGRLKPGVTLTQARDEASRIGRDLEREYPNDNRGRSIAVEPTKPIPAPGRLPAALFIALLFALVFLILLIACTNIGAMLLARGVARSREMSLRLALGASRQRIVRLLVTESVLVSVAGACIGVWVALALVELLRGLLPVLPLPVTVDLRVDWRVASFAAAMAGITSLLCGLMPALEMARTDLVSAMRVDPSSRGPRRLRLRHTFVVAQMSMSVLLVVTALLLGRSLVHAGVMDPGFTVAGVDVIGVDVLLGGYDNQRGAALIDEVRQRIERLPGVVSAATARTLPLSLGAVGYGPLRLAGQPFDPRAAVFPDWNIVSARYFETMRIPLVRGRAFTAADRSGSPEVVIINETLARRLFRERDPIGQTVLHQQGPPPGRTRTLEIVGVARDGKYRTLGEDPRPFAYVPDGQMYNSQVSFVARTTGPSALAAMRGAVRGIDPNLPIVQAGAMSDLSAVGLLPQRIATWCAAAVGVIALLLAMIGIYGITSHSVAQRRREIGIRIALGALRRQVLGLTMVQAMTLTAIGAGIGLAIAAGVAQLLTGLLYGITALDPVSFAGAALTLAIVAALASVIPARRAASIDPVEALRAD
jgi:putative ABC transport system permease protein